MVEKTRGELGMKKQIQIGIGDAKSTAGASPMRGREANGVKRSKLRNSRTLKTLKLRLKHLPLGDGCCGKSCAPLGR
jgi:hypothetical protein